MPKPEDLTIREAAAELNLSEPRIHQLLALGQLEGPALPRGRMRHSPGAPRVTRSSVERYLVAHQGALPRTRQAIAATGHASQTSAPSSSSGSRSNEAAMTAAQHLKVQLDTMREQLREERMRSKKLLAATADLVDVLRSVLASADELDQVTDGYSDALTQLLSPDTLQP